ncbi:MAG: hypothetical protein WC565_06480 [Parcubacteria group bacterium]
MKRDNLIRDLLAAIEDFDREASRSIMVMHRGKYNFILDAAKELRATMKDDAAPQYVVVPDKGVTGGYQSVAIVPGWCSTLAFMPADMAS